MEVHRVKVIKLLIIAAILRTVDSEDQQLDMSPNAVDDQYLGCREEMLQKVLGKGGLIEQELTVNQNFLKAWKITNCQTRIPNGKIEHTRALELYTKSESSEFNSAMQSQGGSATAYQGFQFKALHFLLTDAMQILRPTNRCASVFHESEHFFQARVGDTVKFGMFISANSEYEDESIGENTRTLFNITSCAAVNVEDHACFPENTELLIPPFEEFRVLDVKNVEGRRVIFLNHARLHSNHNCLLFSSAESISNPVNSNMLLLLVACLCLCYHCLGHV